MSSSRKEKCRGSRSRDLRFLTVCASTVAAIVLTAMAAAGSGTGSGASQLGPVAPYAPHAQSSTALVKAAAPQGPSRCFQQAKRCPQITTLRVDGWRSQSQVPGLCTSYVPHFAIMAITMVGRGGDRHSRHVRPNRGRGRLRLRLRYKLHSELGLGYRGGLYQ